MRKIEIKKEDKYIFGYTVVGEGCGLDQYGVFHCTCGQCFPLRIDVRQDREHGGNDGSQRGNHRNNRCDNKPLFLRATI